MKVGLASGLLHLYFSDPDGFAWEVAWNPAWRIAKDGTIEFH
jgi:hypothetical protein